MAKEKKSAKEQKEQKPAASSAAVPEKREQRKEEKKERRVEKRGKKKHRNKPTSKKYKHYKINGDKITKSRTCPRCGPGVFLSVSGKRLYCGKCHYTSFEEKEV